MESIGSIFLKAASMINNIQGTNASGVDAFASLSNARKTGVPQEISSAAASGEVVKLSNSASGQTLLMARIFNAPAQASVPVATADTGDANFLQFLTLDDRAQLSKLYEYASNSGIQLEHVDALARDLAHYRQIGGAAVGQRYDVQGNGITYNFSTADQKVADRVLSNPNTSSSALDQGFIRNIFDANQSPTHISNFKFIEKAISVLSATADPAPNTQAGSDAKLDLFDNGSPWVANDHVTESIVPGVHLSIDTAESAPASGQTTFKHAFEYSATEDINSLLDEVIRRSRADKNNHPLNLSNSARIALYSAVQKDLNS